MRKDYKLNKHFHEHEILEIQIPLLHLVGQKNCTNYSVYVQEFYHKLLKNKINDKEGSMFKSKIFIKC